MEITYGDELRKSKQLLGLTEKATAILDQFVGPSGDVAKVHWDLLNGNGQRARLRINDPSGEVVWDFSVDELRDPERTARTLNLLWGDLLQIRSHKQIEELLAGDRV